MKLLISYDREFMYIGSAGSGRADKQRARRTDGRADDQRPDGQTDGRADGQTAERTEGYDSTIMLIYFERF